MSERHCLTCKRNALREYSIDEYPSVCELALAQLSNIEPVDAVTLMMRAVAKAWLEETGLSESGVIRREEAGVLSGKTCLAWVSAED